MATYYIDFFNGDDAFDGASAQSPKKTQGTLRLNGGDSVLFKRGTVFRGKLDIVAGNDDAPIYYGAYGEGEAPIFCGSTDVSFVDMWRPTDKENVWECVCV